MLLRTIFLSPKESLGVESQINADADGPGQKPMVPNFADADK
jgi:hypothetical protein